MTKHIGNVIRNIPGTTPVLAVCLYAWGVVPLWAAVLIPVGFFVGWFADPFVRITFRHVSQRRNP